MNPLRILFSTLLLALSLPAWAQSPRFTEVTQSHLPAIARSARNSMDVRAADLDADGDLDLVIAVEFVKNWVFFNDGEGHLTDESHHLPDLVAQQDPAPYRYYPYHDSEDVAIADFDHDGDLDVVIVTEDDQTNEFYGNRGDGTFEDWSARFPVTGVTNGVIAADVNDDGWMDLVLANNGQNELLINREGDWEVGTAARLPQRNDITQDVEAADFDGDGDLDLMVANELGNRLLRNDGKGFFEDITELAFPAGGLTEETREADWGDVNGDGRLDLFFANVFMFQEVAAVPRLMIQQSDGTFVDEAPQRLTIPAGGGFLDSDLVDLDADGDLDLLLAGVAGPQIHLNRGDGTFHEATQEVLGSSPTEIGVDIEAIDLNGDGKLDLYLANFRGTDRYFLQE